MTAKSKFVGRSWVDVGSVTESELRYFLQLATTVKAAIAERRTSVYRL
ncbi:MAG: hypothetical protein HY906_02815, partial [Deltaproteobacteria bacterium]|nr:hypothetical protein [Deltaproteobacteria bacterium]